MLLQDYHPVMKELEDLHIEATTKTPSADLISQTGELTLTGRSIPENAIRVYEPVFEWVKEYIKSPRPVTNLRLNLEYFNTATSIWIAKIAKELSTISKPDYVLFIHLYFSIEDFEEMESDDIKEELAPITDMVANAQLSIGIKIYGIDDNGVILKEHLVFM